MSGGVPRCAVYFAPEPGSALARFGAEWLGYDVATGEELPQPGLATIAPEALRAMTAEPRRYGFHATLKPPFALASERGADELDVAVAALAGGFAAFAAPKLRLAQISGFQALVLTEPCPILDRLAALCVRELDRFRAAPSAAELARRGRTGLSPAQEALLIRWGYPYVMAEFRFHMTLTARLDTETGALANKELAARVEPLCRTRLPVDAISLFHQASADSPFRLVRRYPLTG